MLTLTYIEEVFPIVSQSIILATNVMFSFVGDKGQ